MVYVILLEEKLFFRMIYETTTRPRGVLESRIELWNRNTGEITFPKTKGKYNRWTRRHIPGAPGSMKLTGNTSEMLRHFEKMIDEWPAEYPETSVHQTQRQGITSDHVSGTEGEAEERHHDLQWWLMCLRRLCYKVRSGRRQQGGRWGFLIR